MGNKQQQPRLGNKVNSKFALIGDRGKVKIGEAAAETIAIALTAIGNAASLVGEVGEEAAYVIKEIAQQSIVPIPGSGFLPSQTQDGNKSQISNLRSQIG
ncbi:MAG TPA: hypothetical protein DCS91_18820 [Microcoleaceae bacterium UBA11344]|nr:hypothetical protein [Microcoleaceae cyanobacterium UBA11344]